MGLDSVELIMNFENYFKIQIPDPEAEKLDTVKKVVDSISIHLNITDTGLTLRDKLLEQIIASIKLTGVVIDQIAYTDLITNYISPRDKEKWWIFKTHLNLEVPTPETQRNSNSKLGDKLIKILSWTPLYEFEKITVEEFVDAVAGNNYRTLVNPSNIKTKYEIFIAVIGITVDKMGVNYFEVKANSSFTNDLGVD